MNVLFIVVLSILNLYTLELKFTFLRWNGKQEIQVYFAYWHINNTDM